MKALMKKFFDDESGATMVEYAILVALISVVAIIVIAAVGQQVNAQFDKVQQCLKTPGNC